MIWLVGMNRDQAVRVSGDGVYVMSFDDAAIRRDDLVYVLIGAHYVEYGLASDGESRPESTTYLYSIYRNSIPR